MRPGLAAKELLGNILDSFSTRRLVKRDKAQKRCRAQGTKAWNARLRATRPARTISRRTRSNQVREPQLQSPFFGKLPLELRMLIYTYALAEQELLFQVINEETGRNCDETGNMDVPFHLVCNTAQALLSFPLSCTIAYQESFKYLYTSNTFRLAGVTEYWCLTQLVPRRNLDLIQNLYIQFYYPWNSWPLHYDELYGFPPVSRGCWKETWDHISTLQGLKHVQVDINRQDLRVCYEDEVSFFAPIKALKSEVNVIVRAPWKKRPRSINYNNEPEETYPFTIKRDVVYLHGSGSWNLASTQEMYDRWEGKL